MKVSIIVPVYNVEKYIEKCIQSILTQTYKDYELILVDDGSTDDSGKICDSFEFHSKIKVIHKENGGLSDARNAGIDVCSGRYILFIDSDDYVKNDYVDTLVTIAYGADADLVISRSVSFYEGELPVRQDEGKTFEKINKSECYRRMLLQDGIDVSSWAKLYRRTIFERIRFSKGRLYEDIDIIDKIIEVSHQIVVTDYAGYYYRQRKDSIMYGQFSESRLVLLRSIERLMELMGEKYPENMDAAKRRYVYCNFHLLGRSILDEKYAPFSRQFRNNILKYKKEIFIRDIYTVKERFATLLLLPGLFPFKIVWGRYKKYCKGHPY